LLASRASAAAAMVIRSVVIGVPETFIIVYPRAGVKAFHGIRAIQSLGYREI
jgi:dUTPase